MTALRRPTTGLDDDQLRRARLIALATAAMAAYLLAVAIENLATGQLAAAAPPACTAALAVLPCLLARRGQLAAAEWATAGVIACGTTALIALQGPVSSRLGILHLGVLFLGLTARPWMAAAQVAFSIVLLRGALAADVPIALAPSTAPVWLGIVQQILFSTALMTIFTSGYRRLHASLAGRTARLETAHADLLAARARLEQLVADRTAELERATADLEAFASIVAHDLRAPLRHVRSFLELFAEDTAELGDARLAPVVTVQRQAGELATTIETILSTSRHSPRRK